MRQAQTLQQILVLSALAQLIKSDCPKYTQNLSTAARMDTIHALLNETWSLVAVI